MASDSSAALFGIASAASWGGGDFLGGLATKRASVLGVVLLAQGMGLAILLPAALASGEPVPGERTVLFAAGAGVAGLVGIAGLYHALAIGKMGVAAPITGVLAAGIPVGAGIAIEGLPAAHKVAGFALAVVGIWLVSRPESSRARVAGVPYAIVSGVGFGAFLILFDQIPGGEFLWPLVIVRIASVGIMVPALLAVHLEVPPSTSVARLAFGAGVLDAGGNAFFLLAAQAGRLDVAAVLSSLYPVFTTILALVLLHERLTRPQSAGIALALAAIPLIAI